MRVPLTEENVLSSWAPRFFGVPAGAFPPGAGFKLPCKQFSQERQDASVIFPSLIGGRTGLAILNE
jgi:hypothetical protein